MSRWPDGCNNSNNESDNKTMLNRMTLGEVGSLESGY